jgi:hypothetical protein
MAINFTNNFHSKALQNIPKFEVFNENKSSGNPCTDKSLHCEEEEEKYFWIPNASREEEKVVQRSAQKSE